MRARRLLDEARVSGGTQRGADPLRLLGVGVGTQPDAIGPLLVFSLRRADFELAPAESAAVLRRAEGPNCERFAARMHRCNLQMEVLWRRRCFSNRGSGNCRRGDRGGRSSGRRNRAGFSCGWYGDGRSNSGSRRRLHGRQCDRRLRDGRIGDGRRRRQRSQRHLHPVAPVCSWLVRASVRAVPRSSLFSTPSRSICLRPARVRPCRRRLVRPVRASVRATRRWS